MAPPFNPLTITTLDLQSRLQSGSLTTVQILETYLAQIEKHNHAGQKLNAIISIAPRDSLFAQAQQLDQEREQGKLRGPLHGLPTVVKDCFTFAPEIGLKTTVGSHVFAGEKAKGNARLIQQLLQQGSRAEDFTPGYSAYGGQTRSAYDTAPPGNPLPNFHGATAGGSSAGSGVSVSAGFAPFSIGTETGGSLVYPASKAGLYAMRPTHGSVSAKGCFRISRSFDGIGGMAKTAADLAMLIEVILTPEASKRVPGGGFVSVMKGKAGLEGLRIGFVDSKWGTNEETRDEKWGTNPVVSRLLCRRSCDVDDIKKMQYEGAVKILRENGAHVLYPLRPPAPQTLVYNDIKMKKVAYHEFKTVIQEFCNEFEDPGVRTVEDIIKFNSEHKEIALPRRNSPFINLTRPAPNITRLQLTRYIAHVTQSGLEGSRDSPLTDTESDQAAAQLKRLAGKDGMERYMQENDIEMIVSGSDCNLISFNACAGYPSATVPLGNQEDGSPFGLFLLVKEDREDLLFRFMSAFEDTMERVKGPSLSF
ncbi:amidase [Hyphodiscus hymeniophilus]|uniref:Amidase n=1 Tax=Hyphodiscus hymeniophilus TaxID=353542 RepID=A0A9P7AYF4_9HELO|nr:amidase [Hyphodiscus hymeniophilus]